MGPAVTAARQLTWRQASALSALVGAGRPLTVADVEWHTLLHHVRTQLDTLERRGLAARQHTGTGTDAISYVPTDRGRDALAAWAARNDGQGGTNG